MEFLQNILATLAETSWVERFSVLCGVTQVLLSRNNKISNYLFGIAGILSSMYILFNAKLYGDLILNMYYLIMSIYGYWFWKNKKSTRPIAISLANKKDWKTALTITFLGFLVFYTFLTNFTDSDVPIWDAWVSSTAWAGMWLLAKRKLENWILLNISNLFAIPLLIHKELYLFAALTSFLFVVAISGYLNWKKIMKES